jgi:hypothetical protein
VYVYSSRRCTVASGVPLAEIASVRRNECVTERRAELSGRYKT